MIASAAFSAFSESKQKLLGVVFSALILLIVPSSTVNAQTNSCPPGFNDTPALTFHLNQSDIEAHRIPFGKLFNYGRLLFTTDFNKCDGAGRPGTTGAAGKHGVGNPRQPDPLLRPRFTGISGPDSNSCASCHNEPEVGGAGDFRDNLMTPAEDCDPVAGIILQASIFGLASPPVPCKPVTPTDSNGFFPVFPERGSLGMFGSGAIELLAREMTSDLMGEEAAAIAKAEAQQQDVTVALSTKGVQFGSLTAHLDGSVDTSQVEGVSPDLVIRAFGRKGQNKSIRHFTIQGFNRHLGMQSDEAIADFSPNDSDPDEDGVSHELTVGDVTATVIFEAALPVPRRANLTFAQQSQANRGEKLFSQTGCASCHIPALPLRSTIYCEPNPLNATGDYRDTSHSYCFDLRQTSGLQGNMVQAFTDLKRHTICDPTKPYDPETNHFCDDPPLKSTPATDNTGPGAAGTVDRPLYHQFLTAKLWDTGNSGPWGHRNDLDTIYAAIEAHGGEATAAEHAFDQLSDSDQLAIVTFLKTLQMPIMPNNPMPQAANAPTAPNPGGGFAGLPF
jgi:cytochrome c553